ncbi:MAG: hypothetical protein OEZ02_02685 [Anaerolineae bacterium]|nr:hypothetical protein [Anaerolineae bacterium]
MKDYRKLSKIFFRIGFIAWVMYFSYLLFIGKVSIVPFLSLHLFGVLGGMWTRAKANQQDGQQVDEFGRSRRKIGGWMIFLGVLAWTPYIYMKNILGQSIEITPYLTAHLTGVLGGLAVWASIRVEKHYRQKSASS